MALPWLASGANPLPAPLAAYTGQVVYLDFWASWCGPCAQSFPWLNEMQAKYGDRLKIVAVNVDSDPAAARQFLDRHAAKFEIRYDPQGQLAELYRIKGMPDSLILDRTGAVLHQHEGFRSERVADYETAIQQALGEPSANTRSSH
ncbi:TlpA disulfide reductase family protein [uncultured Nevskia sp.]|uniref:TlpA family protein disulfide reductase n=1 Tax=uncultured Nevskia sp. TaxID=228950 RepID=UPI0025ECE817|nr:TlpA disulfide reductase family protein [uncultured Nevskia sp.]